MKWNAATSSWDSGQCQTIESDGGYRCICNGPGDYSLLFGSFFTNEDGEPEEEVVNGLTAAGLAAVILIPLVVLGAVIAGIVMVLQRRGVIPENRVIISAIMYVNDLDCETFQCFLNAILLHQAQETHQ